VIPMILSLCLAAAAASATTPETAMVSFELREGERMIGSPSLQVRIGEPASVSVGGGRGYRLDLTVSPGPIEGGYMVRSALYRAADEEWRLVGSPSLLVARGAQARAAVDHGPNSNYSISVTVR
jgi:hypothetical protein